MRKLALIVLDGFGIGEPKPNNAIFVAKTPFLDTLMSEYPHTALQASGEHVGLPVGQIGGSEVGHLTIGAGRVIYQDLPRITKGLVGGMADSKTFQKLVELGKQHKLHLIGLLSPGGIHSHEDHLFKLLELLETSGCLSPYIHIITDGRDTGIDFAKTSVRRLEDVMNDLEFGTIATVSGRYFGMDRDNNLDRVKKLSDMLLHPAEAAGKGSISTNVIALLDENYQSNIFDEFIEPVITDPAFKGIQSDEPMFFFNFRSDRMKQLVSELHRSLPHNPIITMTQYDKDFSFLVLFEKQEVKETLGEIISRLGHSQIRAAESEKYAHITYFFNGGVEVEFAKELRTLTASNKVKHDELPNMKAREIHLNVIELVKEYNPPFILINFANADMIGHTGNFDATVKAVEKIDSELAELFSFLTEKEYICCVTADHGNAEDMYDLVTGDIHTAHTLNPVPFIVYDRNDPKNQMLDLSQDTNNGLQDVAGTVLQLMELKDEGKQFRSLIL